jgi:ankyrin repeat protein
MEYNYFLHNLNKKIYKLPKLSNKAISSLKISREKKLVLFGFYEHYEELDNYNINELNNFCLGYSNKNIFIIAAYFNKIRLINYLITRGVNINISTKYGRNAYFYALINPNIKIKTLKLLEANGINIHKIDDLGNNCYLFHNCIAFAKIKILEHLKLHNINIYKSTNSGMSPYLLAISNGNFKIIKYLEANGFNIHIKNKSNFNFIYKKINYIRVLKYLNSRNIKIFSTKKISKSPFNKYILIFNSTKVYKYYIIYI